MHLKEHIILAKSKASGLDTVINLNCSGMGLDDISIMKELANLELVSLSANNITSLEALECCSKLQSVFLRQNKISDLSQLTYLAQLPMLSNLVLSENPLCELLGPDYRATVLSKLPQLKKLDGVDVTEKELKVAVSKKSVNTLEVTDSNLVEAAPAPSSTSQLRNNLCEPQPCADSVPATCSSAPQVPDEPSPEKAVEKRKMEEHRSEQPCMAKQMGSMGTGPPKGAHRSSSGCDASGVVLQATYPSRRRNPEADQMRLLTAAECILNNLNVNNLEKIEALAHERINKISRST